MKSRWLNCRGEHVSFLLEGVGDWFVVLEGNEVARSQQVAEILQELAGS
jgi:hypothetical protein